MFTNTGVTLFLSQKVDVRRVYEKLQVEEVYWEDVEQATIQKTGQKNSVSVLLVIPLEGLENPLEFTIGEDLVVKGLIEDEIDSSTEQTIAESKRILKAKYRNFRTVTGVDPKLFGSESVQHYQLTCK